MQVNAAGDLALRGGWFDSAAGVAKPWSIGVVNPDNRAEIVEVYEITMARLRLLELMNAVRIFMIRSMA
jgi:hypothetical protein